MNGFKNNFSFIDVVYVLKQKSRENNLQSKAQKHWEKSGKKVVYFLI
jgi:hypothetical protein